MLISSFGAQRRYGPRRSRRLSSFRGFGGFGVFGSLPDDIRSFILSQRPDNPGETESLVNNVGDGLNSIPNFGSKWSNAHTISQHVDELRNDPSAGRLNSTDISLANNITDALIRARNYYPWGAAFNRSVQNQAGLNAALSTLSNSLDAYISQIPDLIKQVQKDQADRAALEEKKRQQEITTSTAQSHDVQLTADAAAAVAEKQRSEVATQAITSQKQEILAQLDLEKTVRQAQELKVFGIPVVVAAPVAIAGGIAAFFFLRKKSDSK